MLGKLPKTPMLMLGFFSMLLLCTVNVYAQPTTVFYDEMDSLTVWQLQGANATMVVDSTSALSGLTSMRIDIVDGGANPWSVAVVTPMPLQINKEYTFSFKAKASAEKTFRCLFELGGSPYTARIDDTPYIVVYRPQ